MRYSCRRQNKNESNRGGAYWRDSNIDEHLLLTKFQTTYNYVVNRFPKTNSVLEAGCGLGRWIIPLSREGYNVTGIEIENEAVEIVKKYYTAENLKIVQGDIFDMPFANGSFDLVISLGVLEHFEDQEVQNRAIVEHLRVLKDDGVFFVTVPYISLVRLLIHLPFKWLVSFVRLLKGKKEYFTEYRYSRHTFRNILMRNNLEVVEVMWDDLVPPYSFGLTVDYPLKRFTTSKDGIQYKLNRTGLIIQKLLWKIYPGLVSGGCGFLCKKQVS